MAQDKNAVVATVNEVNITASEFKKSYNENLLFVSNKVVTKQSVLNNLINKIIGIQNAKKENLQKNPLVKKKMEEVLYHAKISKDLEKAFQKIKVTDANVKGYYKNYPEYRTAQILFRIKTKPSKNEAEEALKTAIRVKKSLDQNPDKFSEYADQFSQAGTAPSGGDLGFQPSVKLAPQYFRAIRGKAKGYITPPVRSQFGYHIIKVIDVLNFASINIPLYKKLVYDQKRDKIIDDYFARSRRGAKISVNKKVLENI